MNAKQMIFVREVASGKSQAEAYRIAYPKSRNWKPGAVYTRSSELANKPEIKRSIKDLVGLEKPETIEEVRVASLAVRALRNRRAMEKTITEDEIEAIAEIASTDCSLTNQQTNGRQLLLCLGIPA